MNRAESLGDFKDHAATGSGSESAKDLNFIPPSDTKAALNLKDKMLT